MSAKYLSKSIESFQNFSEGKNKTFLGLEKTLLFETIPQYFITIIASLIFFVCITKAWQFKITIPFFYTWDSVLTGTFVKSILDSGWFIHNFSIGTPNGFNLADFPMADSFNFFIIKFLSYFFHHYAIILNIFYILTFPMVAGTSLFVFKRLGLQFSYAFVASLLFTFLPYHFFRAQLGHIFLASYCVVPIAIWISVLIGTNEIVSFSKRYYFHFGFFLLCALIASSGIYYALFSIFFIVCAGLIGSLSKKILTPLLYTVLISGLIVSFILINLSPTLIYQHHYSENTVVSNRSPFESELYGLRITQMLFPINEDRLPIFSNLKNKYNTSAPNVNDENKTATLGIVGDLGFILLLGLLLIGNNLSKELTLISKLNLCGILVGTIGGFGGIFAYTISSMIRCYDRISLFIAFFSLYAFFFFFQKMAGSFLFKNYIIRGLLLFFILSVGIMTQTNSSFAHFQSQETLTHFNNDEEFVHQIENKMRFGDAIFQLPYVPFPEFAPVVSMVDYDHFRLYLHSHHLKWSYGAIKGRPVAIWQEEVSNLPPSQMIKNLSYAGFSGIFINRNGYKDKGKILEEELSKILKNKPLLSNNNYIFFDIRPYSNHLKEKETLALWNMHQKNIESRYKCSIMWGKGFYELEKQENKEWHWANKKSKLYIINYDKNPIRIQFDFNVMTGYPNLSHLTIQSHLFNTTIPINYRETKITRILTIPEGKHEIVFYSDAARVQTADPRSLYFRITDLHWGPL